MTRIAVILVLVLVLAGGAAASRVRADSPGTTDLWIVNADGSHLRQLTDDAEPDFQPAVSPDGKAIAWTRGAPPQIWAMRSNGTQRRPLTNLPGDTFDPQWSPDGRQIAFTSWDFSQCNHGEKWCAFTNVWVINADGSNPRLLGAGIHPRWAPDSRRLVYYEFTPNIESAGLMLAFVNQTAGGAALFLLASFLDPMGNPPAWSSRGWIAFTYGNKQIDVVRPTGTPRRRLGPGRTPAWSPDGRTLAVVRREAIWLSDPLGGHRRRLANVFAEPELPPTWSPNGRLLAFRRGFGLVVVRAGRPARSRLVANGVVDCCGYALGSSAPAWTRDSRRLIFARASQ